MRNVKLDRDDPLDLHEQVAQASVSTIWPTRLRAWLSLSDAPLSQGGGALCRSVIGSEVPPPALQSQ